MYHIFSLIGFLLSSYVLLRIFKSSGIIESVLVFFCLFTGHVLLAGYILSSLSHLNDLKYWSMLSLASFFISFLLIYTNKKFRQLIFVPIKIFSPISFANIKTEYIHNTSKFEKIIVIPLFLTTLFTGLINLIIVIFTAPNTGDGMTYHLARVAYYLQHNNMNFFDANYWAQVIHPKNATILQIYTYLVSGGNENLIQLVQYISYWIAVISIYGISRKIGGNKIQSMFSALVFALLTEVLLEAATTQNDLIMTAYSGIAIFSLFAFRKSLQLKYLLLSSLAIGILIGIKIYTLLFLPPIALIALYSVIQRQVSLKYLIRNLSVLTISTVLAITVFSLPAGYRENYEKFNNPIGPTYVREIHSFENQSAGSILVNGAKNALRYGFDFLSFDGLPPNSIVNTAQKLIRITPKIIVTGLGIDLNFYDVEKMYSQFFYDKISMPHTDHSYWGILGFGLVMITVGLSATGIIKSGPLRLLSILSLLFFLIQSFMGPYDPWRGRSFILCAVLSVPTTIVCLKLSNKLLQTYLAIIILTGCVSALSTVVIRPYKPLVPINYYNLGAPFFNLSSPSIFSFDRVGQLARNRKSYYEPIKKYYQLVPENASVAVLLPDNSYEYPLFGEGLTRTIIPINSFDKGLQPIPSTAEYLLYSKLISHSSSHDIHLGADWFLRKLR